MLFFFNKICNLQKRSRNGLVKSRSVWLSRGVIYLRLFVQILCTLNEYRTNRHITLMLTYHPHYNILTLI